jgi:bifunctional enzyme CysN/CysC
VADFGDFAKRLEVPDVTPIPISALLGDNVVESSEQMPWYEGPTLLSHLETVEVSWDHPEDIEARFPVQWVIRPGAGVAAPDAGADAAVPAAPTNGGAPANPNGRRFVPAGDYRGYAGTVASGVLHAGDEVLVLPSGQTTRIAAIDTFDGPLQEAFAPLAVTVRLEDDLDISRGDVICLPGAAPTVARELSATVCWMSERPLRAGDRLALKHTTRTVQAVVEEITDRVDVVSLERETAVDGLELNDIGHVRLRTSAPLAFDAYRDNRATGSFILIDEAGNETAGAGLIEPADPAAR